jgi:hypothetical protein
MTAPTTTTPTADVKLTPAEVAARYKSQDGKGLSVRTLSNWRVNGDGPKFIKVGGRVFYRLCDVVEWENARTFKNTSEYGRAA